MMRNQLGWTKINLLYMIIFMGIIVSPAWANYQSQEGRWMQQEKLGMMPESEAFYPADQYDDSINAYQAFNFSPQIYFDPLGQTWLITRNGGSIASAIVLFSPDTIGELAHTIDLEAMEFTKWLSLTGKVKVEDGGYKELSELRLSDKICPMQRLGVPNTVLAYWAGEFKDFGKAWVNWSRDTAYLSSLGFNVDIQQGWKAAEFEQYLNIKTTSKELHGLFFWGHGVHGFDGKWWGLVTDHYAAKKQPKKQRIIYMTNYRENWSPNNLKYRLGLGLIYACGGAYAKIDNFSFQSIFWGDTGTLIPIGTPPVSDIIKPGDQGTIIVIDKSGGRK